MPFDGRGLVRAAAPFILLAAAATPVTAHDTWLLPDSFRPRGSEVSVRMTSGMEFPKPESAPKPDRIARSGVRVAGKEASLRVGEPAGGALELVAPLNHEGVAVVWAQSHPRAIDLKAADVRHYLEEVGALETLGRTWEAAGSPPVGESYVKLAKAYLRRGTAPDESWREPLGLALELVPEADPTFLRVGDRLPVVLLWQGKPLADLSVSAVRPGAGKAVAARSGRDGRVTIELDEAGPWLLKATRVVALPGKPAEWEGTFTTITFEVAAARR